MKTRFRHEGDDWTSDGLKITDAEVLEMVRRCLEDDAPIIVEHWFYRGSCAPDRLIFDEIEAFLEYLNAHASAGDAIHVWSWSAACRNDNALAYGKCPDENGLVPKRGAY